MEALKEATQSAQAVPDVEGRAEAPGAPAPEGLRGGLDDEGRRARERRRKRARAVRQGFVGALVLGAAVAAVLALRPRPVPVDVAGAARGPLVVAIEETGVARVKDRYVVSAPVTGTVSRQLREPGDAVREGEVVAEIAP